MSDERRTEATGRMIRARFGRTFWEGVEREIEAFDASDFADFVAAGDLAIEPRPGFRETLLATLGVAARARFSN